ncbi:hypothetical protein Tco_0018580 [Tanacetum coccineum]|uniref:Uncharacterized protein n=1 Tax=Tanacetum coccineum TaxID=301880 RepID=A0ABQ5D0E0_9ASTR
MVEHRDGSTTVEVEISSVVFLSLAKKNGNGANERHVIVMTHQQHFGEVEYLLCVLQTLSQAEMGHWKTRYWYAYECRDMRIRRISLRNSLVGNDYMVNLLVKVTGGIEVID